MSERHPFDEPTRGSASDYRACAKERSAGRNTSIAGQGNKEDTVGGTVEPK